MTNLIAEEKLQGTFAYLDNVTVCGKDQEEHDENLKWFQEAASRCQITYNDSKSVFSTRKLAILGYIVEEGEIRPDPECLQPLLQLPAPKDAKSLCQVLGFFRTILSGFIVTRRKYDPSQQQPLSPYPKKLQLHLKP